MIIKTKTKIALARTAYQAIRAARSVVGRGDRVQTVRSGVMWNLDLSEGIDFAIYLLGAFEPETARTLKKLVKEGDVALDIGANIGAHTLPIAKHVGATGRVFAFEPTDYAYGKLKGNLALNPELDRHVTAEQIMLTADASDPVQREIYASWPLESTGEVHSKHLGKLVSTAQASVATLDDYVARKSIDRIDLIKIDVDGHEYSVLRGGMAALKRFRPALVMEMSPYVHAEERSSFEAMIELLKECRYFIRDAATLKPVPLDAAGLQKLIPDGAGMNVIAQPA
jgi:FkbM family methyltransferase